MVQARRAGTSAPPELIFQPDFLTVAEERDLLAFIERIEFRTLQMQGVTAKRRIRQYGWHYAFESYQLTPADPVPDEFTTLRRRSADLAGIHASEWTEVLVTEYTVGAGIGWHRDAPVFGIVAAISLRGACRMRFRTIAATARTTFAIELPARSIYLLMGEVRSKWQHMIPATRELRYSITFRTLRKPMRNEAAATG
ncbi:MAG: alpha-ketoglutarate-dependent dioxygenase AlkB [Acidobacteriaceae bacterium]|nr:alpha-ketoglutarate-dependent dioxygenase AlkB [Acidobacteriaceae bacterium]